MINIGIAGGAGYVAGELLRILSHHPEARISYVYSKSHGGKRISEVHEDLFACPLIFTDEITADVDVLFLCLGHGQARVFLAEHALSQDTRIIDLGNDFRLKDNASADNKAFVYGLVELNKDKIATANAIANPGCFASAIELALLPMAKQNLLTDEVHVHALTGSTGAGQALSDTTHFSWRSNNISVYKAFTHQHLDEIGESLHVLQPAFDLPINFIPMRGDFTRGIFASVYTSCDLSQVKIEGLYQDYYNDTPFTSVYPNTIHLKQVVNTNHCLLQIQTHQGKVHITSILDNLLKGAAGQAVQNMNILFGMDETLGLNLKANYF